MNCQNCNKILEDGVKFCSNCGCKVDIPQPAQNPAPIKSKSKKKKSKCSIVIVVLVVIIILLGIICGNLNMSIPEIFSAISNGESLTQRDFYNLQNAVTNQKSSVRISKSQWDTNICPWKEAEFYIKDYVQATPELFYVDIRNCSFTARDTGKDPSIGVSLVYFDELTDSGTLKKVENAADKLLDDVPAKASEWEKAKLIHDALICHVTYEEGTYDQTIYGALVEGEAVCMGYALAYEYLLTRAGIECDTVLGYSSEFDAAMSGTELQQGGHAWNIVTFSDGTSCFVDTCWDDPNITDDDGNDYISYRWFCVTEEDILREGRSTMYEGYDLDNWTLDDDTWNYFVYTDNIISRYEYNKVVRLLKKQISEGVNLPSLRLADIDVYYDMSYAMEHGDDLNNLCDDLGLKKCTYEFTYNYKGDGLICFQLYLNYPE